MALKDDIFNGLAALPRTYSINNDLDDNGWALITLPAPNAPHPLHEDELTIQVRIASNGDYFSLYSPLAILKSSGDSALLEHLLRRNFYAEQTDGLTFAINDVQETDVVQAVYHWTTSTITPDQFTTLLEHVVKAVFTLLDEIDALAAKSKSLDPINK